MKPLPMPPKTAEGLQVMFRIRSYNFLKKKTDEVLLKISLLEVIPVWYFGLLSVLLFLDMYPIFLEGIIFWGKKESKSFHLLKKAVF